MEGRAGAERDRVERNLSLVQRVAIAGALGGAVSNVATGGRLGAVVLVVSAGLVGASIWTRRRGWPRTTEVLLLGTFLGLIHSLAVLGQGIRDTAIALYPVLVLSTALLLDRFLLVVITLASVASIAVLTLREAGTIPPALQARAFFGLSIIVVVTAAATYRLMADVVRVAAEARAKERRLAEANRDLEARRAELERFAYVVSHDLKSPLVTIRGFLDYVEQDARTGAMDRLAADMRRIRSATDRMGRLLDDLLELSRTGRISRPHEDLSFGEVVREALSVVEGRVATRGVRVDVDEAAAKEIVTGDREHLVELLQNLLDNAAKFMGDEPEPRISVGRRDGPPDDERVFFVRDNGIGIEQPHHERIFELFHRLDPKGDGTGVGLALAKRIVETHGGRLWVESGGRGRGATFCFTLAGGAPSP
jgi:signal transduction histidine kinase